MPVVAIVPVLRGEREETIRAIARRFCIGSVVAIVVLLATGTAMESRFSRWHDHTLQARLAVLALVGVLTGLHIATPAQPSRIAHPRRLVAGGGWV